MNKKQKNYKEFNKTLTKNLVKEYEEKGISQRIKERHQNTIDYILKYVNKNSKILEIGCRVGHLLDNLKEKGYNHFYGIDISDYSIKKLKEKGYKGSIEDAQNFELNQKFDCIIISHCLEHCPEPQKVINNIFNHLNEKGILYVEVPNQPKEPIPTKWAHYFCFDSLNELLQFFPENKWKILEKNDKIICVFQKV